MAAVIVNNLKTATQPKYTAQETAAINEYKIKFNSRLESVREATLNDKEKNRLLPDTVTSILALLKTMEEWLATNPNAPLTELQTKFLEFDTSLKRFTETDPQRRQILAVIHILPACLAKLAAEKKITSVQQVAFQPFHKSVELWYTKNQETATPTEFSQQITKQSTDVGKIFDAQKLSRTEAERFCVDELEKAKQYTEKQRKDRVRDLEGKAAFAIKSDVSPSKFASIAAETAAKVFAGLFSALFCLLAGSLAANMAIGRDAKYRLLYFVFGALPQLSIFVILYVIVQRFRLGPGKIPWYTLLPLTTTPATSRLGTFFLAPFYYVEDAQISVFTEEFQRSLRV